MTDRVTVRVGSESAVLVLGTGRDRVREAAALLGAGLASALAWQLLLLPVGAMVGTFAHHLLDLDGRATAWAVAGVSLLELVVGAARYEWEELTRPGRLEFSPPDKPVRWRRVGPGVPGRWQPVARLRGLTVTHWIAEPVDGDPRPRRETYSLRLEPPGFGAVPLSATEVPGDPRRLVEDLRALLVPAGLAVEFETRRYVRAPGRIPSLAPAPPDLPAPTAPAETGTVADAVPDALPDTAPGDEAGTGADRGQTPA
ncbi:hypothetical protein ACFVVX_33475 [Kitasatospora sp. NPDC058170]|uniref:hypothetical protein n=1 Tax=Kitasatospora sp. NPDC058170 TaxID=3346364 RepID=UPI0036D8B580